MAGIWWSHEVDMLTDTTEPDHYKEQSVPVTWVGQCARCRAVHIRGSVLLVDNVGVYPLEGRLRRPASGLVQMIPPCKRRVITAGMSPDLQNAYPVFSGQVDECQGSVYEVQGIAQEALLATYTLGGHQAVIDMVMAAPRQVRGFAR